MVRNIKSQMQSYYSKILRVTSVVADYHQEIHYYFQRLADVQESAQNLMKNMRTSLRCNAPLEDWKFLKKTYTFLQKCRLGQRTFGL